MVKSSLDHQERISAGREASIAKSIVRPLVQEKLDSLITLMIADYRSGSATFQSLLGRTAEMSALSSILDNLESTERQGITSQEKEYGTKSR